MLKENGLSTYMRGGRISGVVFGDRKFRLKTLGFTAERLEELDRVLKQSKELNRVWEKTREKNIRCMI